MDIRTSVHQQPTCHPTAACDRRDRVDRARTTSRAVAVSSPILASQNWWASVESSRASVEALPPEITSATWSK
jgi:hypothetical protein